MLAILQILNAYAPRTVHFTTFSDILQKVKASKLSDSRSRKGTTFRIGKTVRFSHIDTQEWPNMSLKTLAPSYSADPE